MTTALDLAIETLGSQSALARAISTPDQPVSPQTVHNWTQRGRVPAEKCPDIEHATGGLVRCEDLRPDVSWHHLRSAQPQASAA